MVTSRMDSKLWICWLFKVWLQTWGKHWKIRNKKIIKWEAMPRSLEFVAMGRWFSREKKIVLGFGLGQVYKLNDLSLYLVPCPHISNKLNNRISEYCFLRSIIFNFDLICWKELLWSNCHLIKMWIRIENRICFIQPLY